MQTTVTPSLPSQPIAALRMADLTKKLSASRGTIYGLIKDPPVGFFRVLIRRSWRLLLHTRGKCVVNTTESKNSVRPLAPS
jgi:hypothetical protein